MNRTALIAASLVTAGGITAALLHDPEPPYTGAWYATIRTNNCNPALIRSLTDTRPGADKTTFCSTLRQSNDGKKSIIKWRGDMPPPPVGPLIQDGPMTHEDALVFFAGPDWTEPPPEPEE